MNRMKIIVPNGIRYVGQINSGTGKRDWEEYDLKNFDFPHIVNKVLTGCGYTEYCLTNDQDLVLISPRKFLLENKLGQHLMDPNIYYAENKTEIITSYERDVSKNSGVSSKKKDQDVEKKRESIIEFKDKIREHITKCRVWGKPVKILVTYDSFRHVKEAIRSLSEITLQNFQIVVDEFQSIFIDARFKSEAELELVNNLQDLRKVCFVSATPMLDKYLDMLDEFKSLPYYEFDWETEEPRRITKPKLDIRTTTKSLNFCISKIIQDYLAGKFEAKMVTDENTGVKYLIQSKEAVFFLNSVTGICKAITTNLLSIDQCNILCAKTSDNDKQIREAFNIVIKKKAEQSGIKNPELLKDTVIGEIPLEGQPHKMFTFCTRTVYLGADFYSTCANTYIFSDSNIECLSVDISMDLEQILGRQRLVENPWKNNAIMFIKTIRIGVKTSWEEFKEVLDKKEQKTLDLLSIYQEQQSGTKKHVLAETYQRDAKMCHYRYNYVAVNEHAGNDIVPVFNRLMQVSEIRAFEIQQTDYADRFTVTNAIQSRGLVGNIRDKGLIEKLKNEFLSIRNTEVRLQKIVNLENYNLNEDELNLFFSYIPGNYREYYELLGFSGIRAHRYNEAEIKRERERLCGNSQREDALKEEIYRLFEVGNRYVKSDIKATLKLLYERLGYKKTAKASDIQEYFEVKGTLSADKKAGFELLNKK